MPSKVTSKWKYDSSDYPKNLAMGAAIKHLRAHGIWFEKKSNFHLKCGTWNYWPHKRRAYRDGDESSLSNIDVEAFVKMISRRPVKTGAV